MMPKHEVSSSSTSTAVPSDMTASSTDRQKSFSPPFSPPGTFSPPRSFSPLALPCDSGPGFGPRGSSQKGALSPHSSERESDDPKSREKSPRASGEVRGPVMQLSELKRELRERKRSAG